MTIATFLEAHPLWTTIWLLIAVSGISAWRKR